MKDLIPDLDFSSPTGCAAWGHDGIAIWSNFDAGSLRGGHDVFNLRTEAR